MKTIVNNMSVRTFSSVCGNAFKIKFFFFPGSKEWHHRRHHVDTRQQAVRRLARRLPVPPGPERETGQSRGTA
jgi:hypothetical protein